MTPAINIQTQPTPEIWVSTGGINLFQLRAEDGQVLQAEDGQALERDVNPPAP